MDVPTDTRTELQIRYDLNRAIHARGQDLNLPGSPSGQSAHPQLAIMARRVFQKNMWHDMTTDEMRKTWAFMDTHKRLPARGEIT